MTPLQKVASCGLLTFLTAIPSSLSYDGYTWFKAWKEVHRYEWVVLDKAEVQKRCGTEVGFLSHACAFIYIDKGYCRIVSWHTEEEAKIFKVAGPESDTTLFEHEVWNQKKTKGHCAGWDHKEKFIEPEKLSLGSPESREARSGERRPEPSATRLASHLSSGDPSFLSRLLRLLHVDELYQHLFFPGCRTAMPSAESSAACPREAR